MKEGERREAQGVRCEGGWRQFGKLLLRMAAGKFEVKCPRCSLNIKIDKGEIQSILAK